MSESVDTLPGEERLVSRDHLNGIPVLTARGNSIAVAWENSLLELWNHGCHIENQYEENYEKGHALSVDATMTIVIEDPMSEPALHRCFPAGLSDLEEYRMEFVEGIKDHWVKHPDDPDYSGEWTYTYSQRFKKYHVGVEGGRTGSDGIIEPYYWSTDIDQVQYAIDALAKSPHSRRVKLVTWQPWIDLYTEDPPCLCEFWLRCSTQRGLDGYILNGNVIFRSRDAYDAAFMNLWGEVAFLVYVAGQLQLKLGKPVRVGRLVDMSHSYHLYGKRIPAFKEGFLGQYDKRTLEERTWTRAMAQPLFDEARPGILAKIRKYDAQKR